MIDHRHRLPSALALAALATFCAPSAAALKPQGITTHHLSAELLVRSVETPTRAALDWAAFDRNPLHSALPRQAVTGQTRTPEFGSALFPEVFVGGSAAASLPDAGGDFSGPLAWPLLFSWLEREDYQGTEGLAEAVAAISRERWGGKRAGQEIAAAFLRAGSSGEIELWLAVEFAPGIKTGAGFGDFDGNGRADFVAKIKPELIGPKLGGLLANYVGRPLGAEEVKLWATELAALWYNKFQTYTLDPQNIEEADDPQEALPDAIRAAIKTDGPQGELPAVLLRGKPSGRWIYNALFVNTTAAAPESGGFKAALNSLLDQAAPEDQVIEAGGALFLRKSVEAALLKPSVADPGGALSFFKGMAEAMKARKIRFVLAPVPLKEFALADMIAPGKTDAKSPETEFRSWIGEFKRAGIEVIDLFPALSDGKSFLPNDTHWTPLAAARAAGIVADAVWKNLSSNAPAAPSASERGEFTMNGDLREMLPPERARAYPPMKVGFLRPSVASAILDDTSASAPVLVISDSFGVVYQRSTPTRAGFVAHLAANLGVPVELIASQGSPVQAARDLLRKGAAHLDGRKVVIFLFSERFLHPDIEWKPLPWPTVPETPASDAAREKEEDRE